VVADGFRFRLNISRRRSQLPQALLKMDMADSNTKPLAPSRAATDCWAMEKHPFASQHVGGERHPGHRAIVVAQGQLLVRGHLHEVV